MTASNSELETFSAKRSREGKDLKVAEGGSEMEGSSGRRMILVRSDVAEADFEKAGYGGGSRLTLRVMVFLVAGIRFITLMRVKF